MNRSISSPAPLAHSQHWIGAFFDMDNTLVPGPSIEIGFFRYLWQDGVVGWAELWNSLTYAIGQIPPISLSPLRRKKLYLLGHDVSLIERLANDYIELFVYPRVSSRALGRLRHHQNAGHVVAVVSGSPEFLVKPLAAKLGVPLVFGARLEIQAGLYTSRVFAPLPYGVRYLEFGQVDRIGRQLRPQRLAEARADKSDNNEDAAHYVLFLVVD